MHGMTRPMRNYSVLVAVFVVASTLAACSSTPSLEDIDLSQVEPPEAVVIAEAAALHECMAAAGYPDFDPPAMDVRPSLGVPIPLNGYVDLALAESTGPIPPWQDAGAYATRHKLTLDDADQFNRHFMACDDARAEKRFGHDDSERGKANDVLRQARADLHRSPEYVAAHATYLQCLGEQGLPVSTESELSGMIMTALQNAVVEEGPPVGDSYVLGFVGATFDPAGIDKARRLQDQIVAADTLCAATTLDPVLAPFDAKYGALYAALYGIRLGVDGIRP
jgi:hypothetical protein